MAMLAVIVLISCVENNMDTTRTIAFGFGVASGDPQPDGVVLWTNLSGVDAAETATLEWQVSEDSLFREMTRRGKVVVSAADDFCAKVSVDSLLPGTRYYYRFRYKDQLSVTGRTQTLPVDADTVRLAIVNCAKYEGGFFNVYDAVSKMNGLNAVVHLGDYIYEDGGGQKAYRPIIKKTGRKHKPAHELVSLEDYRTRYRQYRQDTLLQHLHSRYPMINIWDDHEFANNAWPGGVNGQTGDKQGGWSQARWNDRVANATKAYDEWIPISVPSGDPIYRSFRFASLVNLAMLDTRMCCRTPQARSEEDVKAVSDSSSLLGDQQLDWLESSIHQNSTVWNLIGNQVLVARRYLGKENAYISLDQWTGYPKDRKRFLNFISNHPEENIIISTGNVHDAFHFELLDGADEKSGKLIAHEFAPGSVSSGNTAVKKSEEAMQRDSVDLVHKNPHLKWFDLEKHSFIVVSFTMDKAVVDFYQVSTVYDTQYRLEKAYSYELRAFGY